MPSKLAALRMWLVVCSVFLTTILFAQKTISGKVTDPNNQPVVGATVTVRGTNIATQTGADGDFSVAVPNDNSVVVISSVGFETQELTVGGQTNLAVAMKTAASNLNEVVVAGYTTQRKKTLLVLYQW